MNRDAIAAALSQQLSVKGRQLIEMQGQRDAARAERDAAIRRCCELEQALCEMQTAETAVPEQRAPQTADGAA